MSGKYKMACEKYTYTLPCDYFDQRHVWLDSAPCPPPLSYQFPRGVFTSFMMEHLNQSDTTRIINRCSQSWSYMDITTEAVTTMEMAMSTEKVTVSTDSTSTEEPKTEAPSSSLTSTTPLQTSTTPVQTSYVTKIVPVLSESTPTTSNAGMVVGVLLAVGVILMVAVGSLLWFLRRKGIFSIEQRRKFSYQSGTSDVTINSNTQNCGDTKMSNTNESYQNPMYSNTATDDTTESLNMLNPLHSIVLPKQYDVEGCESTTNFDIANEEVSIPQLEMPGFYINREDEAKCTNALFKEPPIIFL